MAATQETTPGTSPARTERRRGDQPADRLERAAERAFRLSYVGLAVCVVALVAVFLLSVVTGAAGLPLDGVIPTLLNHLTGTSLPSTLSTAQEGVLLQIRLPRAVLGLMVGASLGMAGAAYQGVFRNPLADPYLLGVSAGAGLGAVLTIGFGLDIGWGPIRALPMAAFVGALCAVVGSAVVARGSLARPATLLLAGVAIAALFNALQTYALQKLDDAKSREVLGWLFGRLNADGWKPVVLLLPYVAFGFVVLTLHSRHLDVLRLGDDEARALGLNPPRSRLIIVLTATLVTAAAVAVSGLIAFVGLVVPHLVRLIGSHSYRVIVPLSALVGAAFLAFVDIGARTLVAPSELPVGVITALFGAPFFALVLWRGTRSDR